MSLELNKIKAICFDVDGTLSDTDDEFVQRLVRFLNPVDFLFKNNDPGHFARKIVMATETPGNFLFGIPDRFGFDGHIAFLGDTIYQIGLSRSDKPFLLIPGVRELLQSLKTNYPLSVVSARGGRSTNNFLNQFNLSPFFESIATAQTCKYTKPYPDPILWAADKMKVSPHECLMVGDTTVDIKAAKAAGAQSVGVLCGFGERKELEEAGADMILESTRDLLSIIQIEN